MFKLVITTLTVEAPTAWSDEKNASDAKYIQQLIAQTLSVLKTEIEIQFVGTHVTFHD